MYDFETLVEELLKKRPELTWAELDRKVGEKRETVGAGYLTDQGALFLVAGELGVSLQQVSSSSDMTIKDLYIGANDVTIVARVLSMYPVSTYKHKKDDGTGKYRRMVLFDGNQAVRFTVWDDQAEEVGTHGIEPDTPVRVVNAYVKQGLDGKPNLNLGRQGRIEVLSDTNLVSKLEPLSKVTEKLTKISLERQFLALRCVVNSEPRYSEFVRSDGSPGSLFQFGVVGEGRRDETRVVIWSPSSQPELRRGQRLVVTNLRSRKTQGGDLELHGDAGSAILVDKKGEVVELRTATVSEISSGKMLLALDAEKKVREVEVANGVVVPLAGDAIVVSADDESGGRLICKTPESLKIVQGGSVPDLGSLSTKLRDAKEDGASIMAEVIALSHGTADYVKLRDGTTVKLGELVVGDDTGEIRVVGWRELSAKIPGIQPGERLRLIGVLVKQTKLGAWTLELSRVTVIEKLRGRD